MAALPSLVTVPDLETWLGGGVTDQDRAQAVLDAASALVRDAAGRTWVDAAGQLEAVPSVIGVVAVQVAARAWRHADGVVSESIGEFSASYGRQATEGLYLTGTEQAIVARHAASTTSGGLWVQPTTRGPALETEFVAVQGGEAVPWIAGSDPPW